MRSGVVTGRLGTDVPSAAGEPRPGEALARLSPPPRRWRRPVLWLSAIVHALIVLALLVEAPRKSPEDRGLGPPSVSVILGPSAETPATPAPTSEAALGVPDAPTVQHSPAPEAIAAPPPAEGTKLPPPPAPAPPPSVAAIPSPSEETAAPPPPPMPAPPVPPSTPSAVEDATAPPSPLPILPTPPIPPAPVPAPPRPAAPPIREAMIQPRMFGPPQPPTEHPAPPAPPRPPRPFVPRQTPAQHPADPNAFPAPTFSSLGGAFSHAARPAATPSREMPGPVRTAASSAYRPQYDLSGDDLGSGWERLFSDWVNRHKYYPDQAAENGEEGTAAVKITIGRNGQVASVSLLERSGSQWLDAALEALFRGQRLPPLPDDFDQTQATLNVQMHYILIRGQR